MSFAGFHFGRMKYESMSVRRTIRRRRRIRTAGALHTTDINNILI